MKTELTNRQALGLLRTLNQINVRASMPFNMAVIRNRQMLAAVGEAFEKTAKPNERLAEYHAEVHENVTQKYGSRDKFNRLIVHANGYVVPDTPDVRAAIEAIKQKYPDIDKDEAKHEADIDKLLDGSAGSFEFIKVRVEDVPELETTVVDSLLKSNIIVVR